MPRVRREVHETRSPRTSKPRARNRKRATSAGTSEDAREVAGAQVSRGEVDAAQRAVDLEQLNSGTVEGFPRLDLTPDPSEQSAPNLEAKPETPAAPPMQPDAVLALADLALQVTCSVVGRGVDVPPELRSLSETERALLAPFSIGAARQLGDYSQALEKYSGLIFATFLGLFAYQRVRALRALEAKVDPKAEPANAPAQSAAETNLPGSPFS